MRSRFKLYSWLLRTPPKKKYRYFEPCPSAWIYVFRRIFLEIYHIPMSWSTWREQFGCGWTKLVQPISYNCPIRIFRISKSSHTITQVCQSGQKTIFRNVPFWQTWSETSQISKNFIHYIPPLVFYCPQSLSPCCKGSIGHVIPINSDTWAGPNIFSLLVFDISLVGVQYRKEWLMKNTKECRWRLRRRRWRCSRCWSWQTSSSS